MRKKSFLKLHREFIRNGVRTSCGSTSGLCDADFFGDKLQNDAIFHLLTPTVFDKEILYSEGLSPYVWGSEIGFRDEQWGIYNSLRQNVILLCAALNGEL